MRQETLVFTRFADFLARLPLFSQRPEKGRNGQRRACCDGRTDRGTDSWSARSGQQPRRAFACCPQAGKLLRMKTMSPYRRRFLVTGASALLAVAAGMPDFGRAEDEIVFNRDIRPILSENCFQCHGPDSGARQADLRLDDAEAARAVIKPGHADQSELVRRILAADPDERMPPPDSRKSLTDEQKQLLVRWIDQGAEFQPHWAFIPPLASGAARSEASRLGAERHRSLRSAAPGGRKAGAFASGRSSDAHPPRDVGPDRLARRRPRKSPTFWPIRRRRLTSG